MGLRRIPSARVCKNEKEEKENKIGERWEGRGGKELGYLAGGS